MIEFTPQEKSLLKGILQVAPKYIPIQGTIQSSVDLLATIANIIKKLDDEPVEVQPEEKIK